MKRILITAALAVLVAGSLQAGDMKIMIKDAYARSSNPKVGAAFMTIMNHGDDKDRLVSASSSLAKRVELHTHKENADGVMSMIEVEEGFPIPVDGMAELARGGNHVMMMGLESPLKDGDVVALELTFEKAGVVIVEVPVDNKRAPKAGAHGHGHDRDNSGHKDH